MTIQVEILQFLHYNPSSSRVEIAAGLTEAPNERTLKRIIADPIFLVGTGASDDAVEY